MGMMEKKWEEMTKEVVNMTNMGKKMAEEYKVKAQKVWNENNKKPEEMKKMMEKKWGELTKKVVKLSKEGKKMAEDYKVKAEQMLNKHKDETFVPRMREARHKARKALHVVKKATKHSMKFAKAQMEKLKEMMKQDKLIDKKGLDEIRQTASDLIKSLKGIFFGEKETDKTNSVSPDGKKMRKPRKPLAHVIHKAKGRM